MKVKWKCAQGPAVVEYSAEITDMGEVLNILQDPAVISITVKKQTPAEYFKTLRTEEAAG